MMQRTLIRHCNTAAVSVLPFKEIIISESHRSQFTAEELLEFHWTTLNLALNEHCNEINIHETDIHINTEGNGTFFWSWA